MNISNVSAALNGQDILSIIHDFVNIKDLSIDNIIINKHLEVHGKYKKVFKISFEALVDIADVKENNLYLKLLKVKVSKVPIFRGITNIILESILKDVSKYGIHINKDIIIINFDILSNYIPYADFKLDGLQFINNCAQVKVKNVVICKNKDKKQDNIKKHDIIKSEAKVVKKKNDKYVKLRNKLKKKVPEKYKPLVEYMLIVPDIAALLVRVFKDKRVNLKAKIMAGAAAAYLISPIDIIPDFLPFIGEIDDLTVAFFGLNSIINIVPENIILENWSGNDNIIKKVKEGVNLLNSFFGKTNIRKSLSYVSRIFKHSKENDKNEKSNNIY